MNSDSLYKEFQEHYDELFVNSDLVLSLPYSVSLFGGTASVFGGPIMNQPIPHRGYIGFKERKDNSGMQIVSYKRMNYGSHVIEEVRDDSFFAPDNIFISQLNFLFPDVHVDLVILTEFEGKNADLIS